MASTRRVVALLAAAALLWLTACGSGPSLAGDTEGTQLQFTAETLDGKPFSGASLRGRPAVLWFWTPWCPTCQRDAPLVARVAAANPTVTFVGVGGQSDITALRDFAAKYGVDRFTELADTDAVVWARFGVRQQPAFAFVGPGGDVQMVRGPLDESELTTRVQALTGP